MQIDDLPPLSDVLKRHNLIAKKSLGQNFILDLNLTSRIARTAGDLSGSHVVEIGPGPGGLTRAILANGAAHVTVIERDRRCMEALNDIAEHYDDRLTIVEGDALEVDYKALTSAHGPAKLIANLPYNVATPLLIGWLKSEPWPPWFQSMTLMFQREVAERIVALEGDPHYGRLGIMCSWRCHANIMFDIPPQAFTPPPKVTSSVVHLEPKPAPLACDPAKLEKVTAAAFQKRRKMLRQSLKSVFDNPIATLETLGIDPTDRAEVVPVQDFVALANKL